MKLLEPENSDYAAYVVKLPPAKKLEGLDNLVGIQILGDQALVAKDTDYGDLALVFTKGTQLSQEFAYENNLHSHSDRNKNQDETGYLEDNRHIRSIKLKGHRSSALVMRLSALSYIKKLDLTQFNDGDVFDRIGDHEICQKFMSKKTRAQQTIEKNKKVFSRVDEKYMPEHYKTDSYFKNAHIIPENADVTVTQKLHGTSIRIGNTIVKRKLNKRDKFAKNVIKANVNDKEYDMVYASRRAIKDKNNPSALHFYSTDIWALNGSKLDGMLPQGYLVYGELIGWTPEGSAIQSKYTYNVPHQIADLYIYRVAVMNPEGVVVDLTYDQLVEFCRDRELKVVPLLWRGKYKDFNWSEWVDRLDVSTLHKYHEEGYAQAVPLSKNSPCDEGVVIRAEGLSPYTLKCKSEVFDAYDNTNAETGELDMEEEGKIDA